MSWLVVLRGTEVMEHLIGSADKSRKAGALSHTQGPDGAEDVILDLEEREQREAGIERKGKRI